MVALARSMGCSCGWSLPGCPNAISPLGFLCSLGFILSFLGNLVTTYVQLPLQKPGSCLNLPLSLPLFLVDFSLFKCSPDTPPSLALEVCGSYSYRKEQPGHPSPSLAPDCVAWAGHCPLHFSSPSAQRASFPFVSSEAMWF